MIVMNKKTKDLNKNKARGLFVLSIIFSLLTIASLEYVNRGELLLILLLYFGSITSTLFLRLSVVKVNETTETALIVIYSGLMLMFLLIVFPLLASVLLYFGK